ncbi:MAG TPA: hypothetical protein PKN33_08215 [Phycisphaerae bacterium]|nr:hypothetical protein [Phycisphaerae bacterium]
MIRAIAVIGFVCALALSSGGCTAPTGVDSPNNGDNSQDNGSNSANEAKSDASRVVMAVISARNEDRREASDTLRTRGPASTPCPFGGSRSTDADGFTTFTNCGMLPGVTLNGRIRYTPGPEGTQGGRIEFFDLEGTNNGTEFKVDGVIEETENADGSLTFEADVKTSQTGDGETDDFNFDGEVKVNEDGTMEGNMRIDTGEDDESPSDCDLNGFNIFDLQTDEHALDGPCGFNEEDSNDNDNENPECNCAPDEECVEFEADDGTMQTFCSNCETNQDCIDKGLGNECSLGLTCTTVECFTSDDCPDGFECDAFLGGGECVEESFFPFPI